LSLSAVIRDPLRKIGALADGDIDLAEAALAIAAADRPRIALEPYRRHLTQLAQEVAVHAGSSRSEPDLDGQIEALSHVVCRRYGYGCDSETFEEAEAANLMRVIDSRRGLPVALGILYIHAARAQGWTMVGLDFPMHFLVRLEHASERRILDPASGLRVMEPAELRALLKAATGNEAELAPAHYAAMDNRAVLCRMQNSIKIRQLRAGQLEDALRTVETMALFAPDAAELWREAGLINARLDNFGAAVTALEEFLRRGGDPAARREAQDLLQRLRARLN
jgi:regulator of sirC expression with transglutaminase-like and TPR domain